MSNKNWIDKMAQVMPSVRWIEPSIAELSGRCIRTSVSCFVKRDCSFWAGQWHLFCAFCDELSRPPSITQWLFLKGSSSVLLHPLGWVIEIGVETPACAFSRRLSAVMCRFLVTSNSTRLAGMYWVLNSEEVDFLEWTALQYSPALSRMVYHDYILLKK